MDERWVREVWTIFASLHIGCTIAALPLEFIDFPANHQVSLGVAYPHIIPVLQCN